MRPNYIHNFRDCYDKGVMVEIKYLIATRGPRTRWVRAVRVPYTAGSLWAAWAVLTGQAYAFEWPKHGDLEKIVEER